MKEPKQPGEMMRLLTHQKITYVFLAMVAMVVFGAWLRQYGQTVGSAVLSTIAMEFSLFGGAVVFLLAAAEIRMTIYVLVRLRYLLFVKRTEGQEEVQANVPADPEDTTTWGTAAEKMGYSLANTLHQPTELVQQGYRIELGGPTMPEPYRGKYWWTWSVRSAGACSQDVFGSIDEAIEDALRDARDTTVKELLP